MLLFLFACNQESKNPEQQPDDTAGITYYQDVAPILAQHCVSCHRADGGAPFPLDTFQSVTPLGSLIESSVVTQHASISC